MDDNTKPATAAPKPWWRSRTIWFNTVCALLATAEASLGVLQPALPVSFFGVLAFVLAVGNAALRVITTTAITAGATP